MKGKKFEEYRTFFNEAENSPNFISSIGEEPNTLPISKAGTYSRVYRQLCSDRITYVIKHAQFCTSLNKALIPKRESEQV